MEFCSQCGKPLERLQSESSWSAKYRCGGCQTRVEVVYGDSMGGAKDVVITSTTSFKNEIPKKRQK